MSGAPPGKVGEQFRAAGTRAQQVGGGGELAVAGNGPAERSRVAEGEPGDALLQAGVDRASIAESVSGKLGSTRPILVVASGADRPAGRELVLKIEEGAWIPASRTGILRRFSRRTMAVRLACILAGGSPRSRSLPPSATTQRWVSARTE